MTRIDATAVLALVRLKGQAWVDEAAAGRIAVGASAAIDAVRDALAQAEPGPEDGRGADFLAALESLAGDPE
jgi:hypothetical protein